MARKPLIKIEMLADREAVSNEIAEIAELRRKIIERSIAKDRALDGIRKRHDAFIATLQAKLQTKATRVHAWMVENRDKETRNRKTKTVKFSSGICRWRINPPSLLVARGRGAAALAFLLIMGQRWRQFVRIKKPEINKDALLANPEMAAKVPGITIQKDVEVFAIVPNETEIEELV